MTTTPLTKVERYKVKKVLEADYKPADGEPFCVTWGVDGWLIWCKTPVHPGGRPPKKSVKRKQGG